LWVSSTHNVAIEPCRSFHPTTLALSSRPSCILPHSPGACPGERARQKEAWDAGTPSWFNGVPRRGCRARKEPECGRGCGSAYDTRMYQRGTRTSTVPTDGSLRQADMEGPRAAANRCGGSQHPSAIGCACACSQECLGRTGVHKVSSCGSESIRIPLGDSADQPCGQGRVLDGFRRIPSPAIWPSECSSQ